MTQTPTTPPSGPPARAVPRPDPARHRRLVGVLTVVALVTYAADQASKLWAVATLTDEQPRSLVGSFLRLQLIRNPGAAFSLGTGSTWLLTLIAIVVLVVVVRVSRRLGSRGWAWAFGLLLGGALGNLTDRLVRDPGVGRGRVVDFLAYGTWFIGNVADIAIVGAAVLIALLAVRGTGVDGLREGDAAAGSPNPPGVDTDTRSDVRPDVPTDHEDLTHEPRTTPDADHPAPGTPDRPRTDG